MTSRDRVTSPASGVPAVSWLYVPGDRPERFAKAAASGADVVIIDLEDAVAPARKDEARANAAAYLRERASDPGDVAVHVRVNDLTTPRGRDDVAALAGLPGLDGLRLPKVESAAVLDALGDCPAPAYAVLESAAGVLAASAVAAHPRVAGVALGEQDLSAELSVTDVAALNQLRLQVVLAAAAACLPPVPMSVYPNVRDEEGLLASCAAGRAIGMFGRAAIHPRQIPVIRRAFTPTEEETARAAEIAEAAERAEREGLGAVALPDGRFVDAPIVARARRTLALARHLAPPTA
ncbi:HpcH/HpaI aldolase/citrate lyase family protein [Nonomuraea roseoviolacea]|uniref:Citrate lyase subunit beta/citryl-CoA lyase n=1 Tax=Nonomuraea roseoviolacea subsp. carminata TaxID=160689 RepID=A0ABT1KE61_9ACTN|nr:CoA ester lyase [Nonomuraea roseoviolacea]MCP2352255.1 citrate lyase subunit beta/citryl-CoA lyase [Nonomuraea roseoviolacea subsp. carminata]